MRKTFDNGSGFDKRKIDIEIDNDTISFYFTEQYNRQKQWVEEETERRSVCCQEPLTEDEAANHEFYWIGKYDWCHPNTNFPNHMMQKSWFTGEMLDF